MYTVHTKNATRVEGPCFVTRNVRQRQLVYGCGSQMSRTAKKSTTYHAAAIYGADIAIAGEMRGHLCGTVHHWTSTMAHFDGTLYQDLSQ